MKTEDEIRLRILARGNPFNRRDLIEISGGGVGRRSGLRARAKSRDPELAEAYFAGHAEKIRDATKPTPLALVGGIRSRRTMEAVVEKGIADMVSMSRPFIREPSLVKEQETSAIAISHRWETLRLFSLPMDGYINIDDSEEALGPVCYSRGSFLS